MKKILLTAIGGDISQSVANCIRDHDDSIKIIGTDIHSKHSGNLYVDEFFIVPEASHPDYLERVKEIIKSNNIDVSIPINESELKLFVESSNQINLIHSGKDIVSIGLDKLKTIKSFEKYGLKVPWTVDANQEYPREYPCIFKPRFGSGSKSIFIINSENEAHLFKEKYANYVFQEYLDPYEKELTCCLYVSKNGSIKTIQFERILIGGLTGWAQVVKKESVDKLLLEISKTFNLYGSINIQLRITKSGPMIFEINPRFSSTCFMRHKLGFTDVVWSLQEYFNKPIKLNDSPVGATAVRFQGIKIL